MLYFLAMVFGGMYCVDPKYESAFRATVEANYVKSEMKTNVDTLSANIGKEYPTAVFTAGTAYAAVIKKEVKLKTAKIAPFGNDETRLQVNKNSGQIQFTFNF